MKGSYSPVWLGEGGALPNPFRNTPEYFEYMHASEMCSGSEAGSYLRLIDFVYHSTLGLRVTKKKKMQASNASDIGACAILGIQPRLNTA